MTSPRAFLRSLSDSARNGWPLALAGAAGLAIGGLFDASGAAQGLLVGWLAWLSLAMGAVVLLAIHSLTGGEWGERARPALASSAAAVPFLALTGLGLLLGLHRIYPWANGNVELHQTTANYLNIPDFSTRQTIALATWAAIGTIAAYRPRIPPVAAALMLVIYAVTASFVSVDWLMSLEPGWNSTAFGVIYGVSSVIAALALLAVAQPADADARFASDLGQLLLAGVLGSVYLNFMQYLVYWSGNLPEKVAWFVDRSEGGWRFLIITAFLVGAVAPFFILLTARARRTPKRVATAGALILTGLYLHLVWQTAPAWTPPPIWSIALATIAAGGLWLLVFRIRQELATETSRQERPYV